MTAVAGRLAGRMVVVTGAASGIGAAIARGVSAEGASVACLDLDADGARAVAESLPSSFGGGCDVTQLESVEAAVAAAVDVLGPCDALVNSAGGSQGQAVPFLELDERAWHGMVDRNLTGSFHCGLVAARHMAVSGGGAIVLISSQLGGVVRPGLSHYSAAKGGVNQLVKGMALDLAPHGIRVNAVAPGPTLTPGNREWFTRPDVQAEHARVIPIGRVGEAEESVGAVVYLISGEASFTTGATIVVDGGYTII